MNSKFTRFSRRLGVLALLLLAACSSPPVLLSKSAAVPVGVDLSGYWHLVDGGPSRRMENADGIREEPINLKGTKRARRKRSSGGVSAHVFLQYGSNLKVTQTAFGIFISYDRSVVEEFTFGENRMVEIGPIEALRVSGWEGDSFVIETLDDSGTMLSEAWSLQQNGSELVRDIRISEGDQGNFVEQQRFERQDIR
jgi:hypothetical protein